MNITTMRHLKSNANYNNQFQDSDLEEASDIEFELLRQKYGEIYLSDAGDEFAICCLLCSEVFFRYTKFLDHMRNNHCLPPKENNPGYIYDERVEEFIIYESDEEESISQYENQTEEIVFPMGVNEMNDDNSLTRQINEIADSVAYVGINEIQLNDNLAINNADEHNNVPEDKLQQISMEPETEFYERNALSALTLDDKNEINTIPNECERIEENQKYEEKHEDSQAPYTVSPTYDHFEDIDDCGILLDRALCIDDGFDMPSNSTGFCGDLITPTSINIKTDYENINTFLSGTDQLFNSTNEKNLFGYSSTENDDSDNSKNGSNFNLEDDDENPLLNLNTQQKNEELENKNQNKEKQQHISLDSRAPFMENKDLLCKFIEAYENHPCLWKADHPSFRDRITRQQAYREIHKLMERKYNFPMTEQQVARKITMLRSSYHRELDRKLKFEKLRLPDSKDEYVPKLWYFFKLSFIEECNNFDPGKIEKRPNETSTRSETFKCDICDRVCLSNQSLKLHRVCHSNIKPFECPICQKRFRFHANMVSHQATHINTEDRKYTCDQCGFKIAHRHYFLAHVRKHSKQYSYHCKECGHGAVSATELKNHLLIHNGEKPFICEVCGQGFKNNGCLTRHLKRHFKIYEYKCDICGKEFVLRSRLNEHMRIHAEHKDHICDICTKTFTTQKSLKHHIMTLHNNTKEKTCTYCGQDCSEKECLHAHMKRHKFVDLFEDEK